MYHKSVLRKFEFPNPYFAIFWDREKLGCFFISPLPKMFIKALLLYAF